MYTIHTSQIPAAVAAILTQEDFLGFDTITKAAAGLLQCSNVNTMSEVWDFSFLTPAEIRTLEAFYTNYWAVAKQAIY